MKISLNWLNEYLSSKISEKEAEEILTNVGLEVEEVELFESIKGGLTGVVIGEVKEKDKHPDADRLSVTKVDIGTGELLQIVCGAPNVAAGQKVVVATVGTVLYPGGEKLEIKRSRIRGVESQGMICAEDELGLGTSHDGIMVLPESVLTGTPASDYFNVKNDFSLDLNITPNRPDATSHIGVARDVVAFQSLRDPNAKLVTPPRKKLEKTADKKIELVVEDTEACPRYSGITITGIQVGTSPQWLQNKLLAVGLRPINNVVDITNYVQFEYGHPLHAFDLDKVEGGKIVVKKVAEGTLFVTLDGVERKLKGHDLMICSATRPMCIAGVFGGLDSGVSESTTSVFIESAYFNPVSVRKTAKAHGLHTDASFRFERGTDHSITLTAASRAAELIMEICGGQVASELMDVYPVQLEKNKVTVSYQRIHSLLGIRIDEQKIRNILLNLGIEILDEKDGILELVIPAYKVDVTRDVDVIEEIIRVYGLNEIEIKSTLKAVFTGNGSRKVSAYRKQLADTLVANGFYEILTNSLLHSRYQVKLSGSISENAVQLLNPISSELDILRDEFIYSGLEVVAHNLNHKQSVIRIFEFGKTYHFSPETQGTYRDHYSEKQVLGMWLCGNTQAENWHSKLANVSFYDLKGYVETVLDLLNIPYKGIDQAENNYFKTAFSVTGFKNKQVPLVIFGEVQNPVLKNADIKHPVYYAEFNWDAVIQQIPVHHTAYSALPKYPSVRRDLALVLDKSVEYGALKDTSVKTEKNLLQEVTIFDVYEGKGVPEGKKSYALSFVFRDKNKTLTDADIDKSMQKLIEQFKKEFNAEIRS